MNHDIYRELLPRLEADYEFKKNTNGWLQGGKCPACGKKELFAKADNPFVLKCGRLNNCGVTIYVKEEYPDLFENWSNRYQQTPTNPHAAADAYLRQARGFDIERLKGIYTQENYYDPVKKIGSATVRFPVAGGYWERIIDQPGRFEKKKAHFNKGLDYQGRVWEPPMQRTTDEIWFVEGIFDSLSLMFAGIFAATPLSCSNYPHHYLKAIKEQCEATDKPLPALVFAYDDGNAGKTYMRKHAERALADGWKASAAYIRNGRLKRDWNDLHLAGQLNEHAIDDARYRGALLLARSAADKAGIMFRKKNWAQFYFDYNNRLYWFEIDFKKLNEAKTAIRDMAGNESKTEQEIHDMAMEQSRAVVEIANCLPTALYYQANSLTDESWYYVRIDFPHDGKPVKNTFTGAQLSSNTEFRKRLLAIAPGALYTGSPTHLDLWLKSQMFGIKTVETIDYIGYSKDHGAWIFDDLAVKDGKVHHLNDEDFFDIGKIAVKSLNQSVNLAIEPDPKEYDTEWPHLLWYCFEEKGFVALAYWLGSLFAEQIRDLHASYPFIEIVGDPGAGKSTLIEFLWKLVGRTGYEGFDPMKATVAARARNFAQVSNLPIVLIESDRDSGDDKGSKQKGFDWDELKTAYNGRSVRSTGVKNSGNDTREPPFRAALVISQNAAVSASDAFMQRLMHMHLGLQQHTEASREAFQRLERFPVSSASGFILRATKAEAAILKTVAERTPAYEHQLDANPNVKHFRLIKNHAQLMALVEALGHVIDMREDTRDRVLAEVVAMAEERQQAINADHPRVQEFWELYDYLESGDADQAVLNHSRNEHEIAINLNHFVQVATDRKQQLPEMADLKKLLRTSKARKFIDIKPVNSAINAAWNLHKSAATPARPTTVKCWVFQRDTTKGGKRQPADD